MILFELKKAILESGLKQTYIARKIGVDPTTLSKKINGYLGMTEKEKQGVSGVLGKNVEEVFPEEARKKDSA